MDLKHHHELNALMKTFVVLGNDVLSSDDESTLDELEAATPHNSGTLDNDEVASAAEQSTEPASDADTGTADYYADYCDRYLAFTDANPTTYHVIEDFSLVLKTKGFKQLSEQKPFEIDAGGGLYFVTRGDQSLVAFIVGGKWKPTNGLGVVGCHVDALTAKLKPSSIKSPVAGYSLLGVAPYSGGLSHLWIDRDLGIAGSVLVRKHGRVVKKLVSSGTHAVARIPSLAPHFGAKSNLPYNKETQMVPIVGYGEDDLPPTAGEQASPLFGKHSLTLLRYIACLAEVKVDQIVQLDLELFDVQAAVRGGLSREFMFAPRVDDRLCSYAAVHALVEVAEKLKHKLTDHEGFSAVLLANNEEIGSGTRTGARGKMLNTVVGRVVSKSSTAAAADTAVAFSNSILLSADVTHALNPNFTDAYLEGHYPLPNTGLTLKKDANGHVMTDLIGVVLMETIAKQRGLTLQQFHIKNDMPSGGTIGPILATDTGARVIDVGLPQLSMHSIRATAGYKEAGIGVETFAAFFEDWREVLDRIDYL